MPPSSGPVPTGFGAAAGRRWIAVGGVWIGRGTVEWGEGGEERERDMERERAAG
jgi:hypothetical protein